MSTIIFKLLIIFISLMELYQVCTCATIDPTKLNLTDDFDSAKIYKESLYGLGEVESATIASAKKIKEEKEKTVKIWTPEIYPNPFTEFESCAQNKSGYICDPDEILEDEDISKLRQSIDGLNADLENYCTAYPDGKQGIDFGIAIMNNFKKIPNMSPRDTATEYAQRLHKKWQLGGQCDNGLLILQSSSDNILTYSMGKTTLRLIKNATITALNLGDSIPIPITNENTNQQSLLNIQAQLLNFSNGLSLVNKDKAISRINSLANNNQKFSNAIKNVGTQLEQHIEKEEEESKARLSELNSNDKLYAGISGELLLIYFLLFILMLCISCLILGVFLKRRLGNSSRHSSRNSLHNLGDKKANPQDKTTRYQKIPTNNNPNLNK